MTNCLFQTKSGWGCFRDENLCPAGLQYRDADKKVKDLFGRKISLETFSNIRTSEKFIPIPSLNVSRAISPSPDSFFINDLSAFLEPKLTGPINCLDHLWDPSQNSWFIFNMVSSKSSCLEKAVI